MRMRLWTCVLLAGLAAAAPRAAIAQATTQPLDDKSPPFEQVTVNRSTNLRHSGTYLPLRLTWTADNTLADVQGVFPHPFLPRLVAALTESGVSLSRDAGRTWASLPEAAPAKIGTVAHVAFKPDSDTVLYLAGSRGVWMTTDGGKGFRRIGSKAAGLAADETRGIYVYGGDLRFETLLAVHGEAAGGISRSTDGGKTWQVLAGEYYAHRLLVGPPGARQVYMVGAGRNEPERTSVYQSQAPGSYWQEMLRDVTVSDLAYDLAGRGVWVASGKGLYLLTRDGGESRKVREEDEGIVSCGATWGSTADTEMLFAYNGRQGMIGSIDGFQTSFVQSHGLETGEFVKEGSLLRANADGAVFLAVVNNVLYRGERPATLPGVAEVTVTPPCVTLDDIAYREARTQIRNSLRDFTAAPRAGALARDLHRIAQEGLQTTLPVRIAVTARIQGPTDSPPSVTLDLSRQGGDCRTPMRDDGQNGDGAAGDGLYGAAFVVQPDTVGRRDYDWRRGKPGAMGLTVSSLWPDGRLAGRVGVLSVFSRPATFTYFGEDAKDRDLRGLTGQVASEWQSSGGFRSRECLRLDIAGGPWSAPVAYRERVVDVTGYHALAFWIRGDAPSREELFVQLRDEPDFTYPGTTAPVPVVKEGLVEGGSIGTDYRRVLIPLSRLTREARGFQTGILGWVVFSGEGRTRQAYTIDNIRFYLDEEDAKADSHPQEAPK